MPTIEELWQELRVRGQETLQRRVDATHPFDLYVEFEPPNRTGLVAVCTHRPPAVRPLRAVTVEERRRTDGRWSLRLSLDEPRLLPVFTALCHDIIDFTRNNIAEAQLSAAIIGRLDHWRNLLERDGSGLSESELRGLIGELSILDRILDSVTPAEAIASWTGPLGTPQDFILPSGRRIEVKAARRGATSVRINGLDQLDAGTDGLDLVVVRIEETGIAVADAITAPLLVERIANRLGGDPGALTTFRASLSFLGWQEHARHHALAVRVVSIDRFTVEGGFPRLILTTVPAGVEDADYTILLPESAVTSSEVFK